MDRAYHHGKLRQALVEAAMEELREHGRDRFSLRRTAARAGVSHAAPAHHFGNAEGLLQAVRAEGFARLAFAMEERRVIGSDPFEALVEAGTGYIALATAEPALFDVMFGPGSPAAPRQRGSRQGETEEAAFDLLLSSVEAARGPAKDRDRDFWLAVSIAWSVVHGYAQLTVAGRMNYLDELGPDREEIVRALLRSALRGVAEPAAG